jgi:hypothetical protein
MPPAPVFLHGAVIFSAAKLSAQPCSSALSENKPRSDAGSHNHGNHEETND